MLMLKLWNYMRGYVIISVEGFFLEKFINICIRRKILLWDVKKTKRNYMTLKVSIKAFKMLRPVAKKTKCRIRIQRKKGMPFVYNKYRGRKAFIAGGLFFIILIYILSSYIWAIEVKIGTNVKNGTVEKEHIIEKLETYGIRPGILKYGIDTNVIINNLMMDIKELTWAGASVKGTKVKIEVVEGVKPPNIVPKEQPCNIIASKDGIIKSIIVKVGEEKVKVNDTVKKGQLLISANITPKRADFTPLPVHALGEVYARTWYETKCKVNTILEEKERTGNKKDNISVVIFSKRINIWRNRYIYENYDKKEIIKNLQFGENIIFPFQIVIDRFYENSIISKEISLDEAKQTAASTAYEEALKKIPEQAQIAKKDIYYDEETDGSITARIVIECIEDIGETIGIGGN